MKGENRTCQETDFDNMKEEFQTDYLERYEGVQPEIHHISQFNESSALNTAYYSKDNMSREDALKAQDQFSLTDQSTTIGAIPASADCKILLDIGITKNFM